MLLAAYYMVIMAKSISLGVSVEHLDRAIEQRTLWHDNKQCLGLSAQFSIHDNVPFHVLQCGDLKLVRFQYKEYRPKYLWVGPGHKLYKISSGQYKNYQIKYSSDDMHGMSFLEEHKTSKYGVRTCTVGNTTLQETINLYNGNVKTLSQSHD